MEKVTMQIPIQDGIKRKIMKHVQGAILDRHIDSLQRDMFGQRPISKDVMQSSIDEFEKLQDKLLDDKLINEIYVGAISEILLDMVRDYLNEAPEMLDEYIDTIMFKHIVDQLHHNR